jgi:hypothetical protein
MPADHDDAACTVAGVRSGGAPTQACRPMMSPRRSIPNAVMLQTPMSFAAGVKPIQNIIVLGKACLDLRPGQYVDPEQASGSMLLAELAGDSLNRCIRRSCRGDDQVLERWIERPCPGNLVFELGASKQWMSRAFGAFQLAIATLGRDQASGSCTPDLLR